MIKPDQTGYALANGLNLYYEVYGSGDPLLLLHGGLGSIEMVASLLPELSARRQVIAFDLQGHGRTADVDRPLHFGAMADDLAAALGQLGFGQVDAMGYSFGGGVVLQLAIRHPHRVRRLVVISFPFRRSGWFPEVIDGMAGIGFASAEAMIGNPLHQIYSRVAPRPEDWTTLHVKLGDLLRQDYDWADQVGAIEASTLLVAGDADSMPPSHIADFYEQLGGGQRDGGWDGSGISPARLAILPGATHYNIAAAPLLTDIVEAFLGANAQREVGSTR